MLIAFGVYGLLGSISVFHGSSQMQSGIQSVGALATVATVLNIGAIVMVFAIKNAGKILGVALIILGIGTLFSMSYFGVIGFALLLAAGIAAMRYKRKGRAEID